jgi:hypothetical protein
MPGFHCRATPQDCENYSFEQADRRRVRGTIPDSYEATEQAIGELAQGRFKDTNGQRLQDGCLNTEIRRARLVAGRNSCARVQRQLTQLCLCGEISRFLHLSAARPGRHLRTSWPSHTRCPSRKGGHAASVQVPRRRKLPSLDARRYGIRPEKRAVQKSSSHA